MIYEIDLHYDFSLFSERLRNKMIEKGLVNKKGTPDSSKLYNLMNPNDKIKETQTGQAVINKTRKQRNWINGKNQPKNITDLMELCNALNVEIEYFYCSELKDSTRDIHYISTETGLKEDTINLLSTNKDNFRNNDFINYLIYSMLLNANDYMGIIKNMNIALNCKVDYLRNEKIQNMCKSQDLLKKAENNIPDFDINDHLKKIDDENEQLVKAYLGVKYAISQTITKLIDDYTNDIAMQIIE